MRKDEAFDVRLARVETDIMWIKNGVWVNGLATLTTVLLKVGGIL